VFVQDSITSISEQLKKNTSSGQNVVCLLMSNSVCYTLAFMQSAKYISSLFLWTKGHFDHDCMMFERVWWGNKPRLYDDGYIPSFIKSMINRSYTWKSINQKYKSKIKTYVKKLLC
jgi:hypothetical protein